MNKNILLAASAMTILFSGAAFAQEGAKAGATSGVDTPLVKSRTAGDITTNRTTVEEFSESIANAARKSGDVLVGVGQSTKSAVQELKADILGEDGQPVPVKFENRMTAKGMIGQDVVDTANTKVATVKDVILDKDGNALLIVVADGGFMGIGDKLAAFDYNRVISQTADGDVIMPLGKDTIAKVAGFSYQTDGAAEKSLVMSADNFSANVILDGNLLDLHGRKAAKVENVAFTDGGHARVIVAYDQTLGMGGRLAAFDFKTLKLVHKDAAHIDVMMGAKQSASFEKFKKGHTSQ